uniref:YjeF N-terminal domain-containing protein n=1 Tax=Electrophorus electricus TaxID=8005 RepID=A0AAY5F0S9_ELEEL
SDFYHALISHMHGRRASSLAGGWGGGGQRGENMNRTANPAQCRQPVESAIFKVCIIHNGVVSLHSPSVSLCLFLQAYPLSSLSKKQPTVLVICGPEQNGSIGLVCARHLRIFEYEPTIYYPKRSPHSLHQDFTIQCEKMDIPFLSYLPTEVQLINDAYNLVIDSILGPETDLQDVKEPYSGILATLKQVKIPIASVDVPSGMLLLKLRLRLLNQGLLYTSLYKCCFCPSKGWDSDEASTDGINPEVLISLMAPKKCATSFSGKHFLAGRFLPYDMQKKYELNLPEFPGTECFIEL